MRLNSKLKPAILPPTRQVFKLKGADRKHKQDRERIQKRPPTEQDKYQQSYECTILNDIPRDNIVAPTIGCYSPEQWVVAWSLPRAIILKSLIACCSIKRNISPVLPSSPSHVPANVNPMMPFSATPIVSSTNGLCKIDQSVVSTQNYESDDHSPITVTKDTTPQQLMQWLAFHRLSTYASTLTHFSGCDVLR